MDLNADLGEGFGVWRLGDDDALLRRRHVANVACGFHAGDAVTMRRVCVGRRGARRRRRRPGRLPRPGRVRPAAHRLRPGRAARRGALPDRRAGRVRAGGRHPGQLRQAARRALQHRGRRRRAGDGRRAAVADYDPDLAVLCLPASALLRAADAAGLRSVTEGFADRGYLGRPAGAAHAAGCAGRRSGRGRRPGGRDGRRGDRGRRRNRGAATGRVDLRTRRHARRGCAGDLGPAGVERRRHLRRVDAVSWPTVNRV